MSEETDFYVILPSNASIETYPSNKIWDYRTKLARAIDLKQPYEVGLIELHYPRTWHNFSDRDGVISIAIPKEELDHAGGAYKLHTVALPPGLYDNIPSLVKDINELLTQFVANFVMQYSIAENRVYFRAPSGSTITFKGRLAIILGFKPGATFNILPVKTSYRGRTLKPEANPEKRGFAPHPADIYGGLYNIYIYTDIVDYQMVGDSFVPLLRAISTTDEMRRMPHLIFDKPHYTRVTRSLINDIQISLKTDQNSPVRFTYGKLFVKLHFRPIRSKF